MKEFTFAAITYNHSDCIIEHLESLKKLVQKYGREYLNNLIISDDASKDNTVELAKKWIEQNRSLFNEVKVLCPEKNQGIVKNYVTALKCIKTEKFKILAGDDLYLCENIYDIFDMGDIIFTPLVNFSGSEVVSRHAEYISREMVYYRNRNLQETIRDKMKFSMYIQSPGTMWKLSLADEGLYETLSHYTWMEDVPLFSYLLNKQGLKVCFCETPVVAYRSDVGISTNKNHERAKEIEEESKRIRKEIYVHRKIKHDILNPYAYKMAFQRLYVKYIGTKTTEGKAFDQKYAQSKIKSGQTIIEVQQKALQWKKEYAAE